MSPPSPSRHSIWRDSRSVLICVHSRSFAVQHLSSKRRCCIGMLSGGKVQKFLFFNLCVIFSLARRGDVDYPCCVARQGGPTEMPFRLLGFSCWDDRSGRFFFTGSACDRLIESIASDGDFPAKWALGVAANLLESCHETDPIW
jgi:hypothetical protein